MHYSPKPGGYHGTFHSSTCYGRRSWLGFERQLLTFLFFLFLPRYLPFFALLWSTKLTGFWTPVAHISLLSWAHLLERGGDVAVYVLDINQSSLTTPFYSVLVSISVFKPLSTVFSSINSPNNSQLSLSVLLVLFLPYWSFQRYKSLWKSPSALI